MGILSGKEIQRRVEGGDIVISPFDPSRLGPNSYDVTLAPTLCTYDALILDAKKQQSLTEHTIPESGSTLYPNRLYLGSTNEIFGVPETTRLPAAPLLEGCSSSARLGLSVHLAAGFGDLGGIFRWTLELTCVHPVRIYPNMRLAQIYFEEIVGDPEIVYRGHYRDQHGPVGSRMWAKIKERENE